MRLYISTLTKKFVQSASYQASLTDFAFKRRDIEPIELYFLDEDGNVTIPSRHLGKAILVSGSHPDFSGRYIPTGSSEHGKPVWALGANLIKRVAARTFSVADAIVSSAHIASLNGKYLPLGTLNGKSRYKHESAQTLLEWKPAETILGEGVMITGPGMFSGLYLPDGTLNGKPRYRRTGVARISWKPQSQSISSDDLTVSNMQVPGVYFDGTYKRAPTPYNGRPRYYRSPPSSPTSILSSIQFESAYSIETEDAQGNSERILMLTTTGGHFSVSLNGRFVKSSGNTIAGLGSGLDKWTIGNEEADIFSRAAGTYPNPYRLNLPDIGYSTSGSYLGGINWYLDSTLHNGQPQWHFGSSRSNSICVLRYDDPTNFKWRFIQTLSGSSTTLAELTVSENDKNPLGKSGAIQVSGAGMTAANGTYHPDGQMNGKPKYSKADGAHIGWHTRNDNGTLREFWYLSTHPVYVGDGNSNDAQLRYVSNSNVVRPDLATDWNVAGTPGTIGPAPSIQLAPAWTAIHTGFNANNLNAGGGLKFDNWVISEDHWILRTTKTYHWSHINSILTGDSAGGKPLAFALKNSTSFPASYAGGGGELAWRSYADGSYGWGTSRITEQIPARWVARQVGTWPPSPPPVDGLYGWDGRIEFYTEDTKANVWETSGWRQSPSQPIGAAIQRNTLTHPSRWLLHEENNIEQAHFEAIVPADVPYGPWLDGNGDSFEDMWSAVPNSQASGSSELSSHRETRSFPARWSLGNDAAFSDTNSLAPWQAINWKKQDGTASATALAQAQESIPEHWGLFNSQGAEQFAAFNSPESPAGASWEASANPNPPQSVDEVEHHATLEGVLAIKKNLLFDGPVLARSGEWISISNGYQFSFNLNTTEIEEAFDGEPESVDGMIELTWSSGGTVTSSFTLPAKIWNDVIRGDDGIPTPSANDMRATKAEAEAGESHMRWMTPLRTREAIEALAPRGSNALAVHLPVPTIRIEIAGSNIQSLERNGAAGAALRLVRTPFVLTSDFEDAFLTEHPVFLEMVILKRRAGKTGFLIPSPWKPDPLGNPIWSWPWPQNFHTRTGRHWIYSDTDRRPVLIERANHLRVSRRDEHISLAQFFNGRLGFRQVYYASASGETVHAVLPCPLPDRGSMSGHPVRQPYAPNFRPLRVSFRYVVWVASANGERGGFLSGPLTPVLKLRSKFFPFRTDHVASSRLGHPAATLDPLAFNQRHQLDFHFHP